MIKYESELVVWSVLFWLNLSRVASHSVCVPVNVYMSGCKFWKWKHVADFLGKSRLHLYKYLEILYLNLAILPVMHEDEPVYHAYKLLIGFFVSSTHMIYACLSKCKTKRQHMYMYIIFKSSIIYFYHWLILTCLNKHHFLNKH